jgi:DNA-binding beta-propeller fold protein YncE
MILILALAAVSGTALAQEELTQTYTSSDGALAISHPAGWTAEGDTSGIVLLANNISPDLPVVEPIDAGEQAVGIIPPTALEQVGVPPETPPAEVIETLANAAFSGVALTEIEMDETEDGQPRATAFTEDPELASVLVAFGTEWGTMLVAAQTGPNELDAFLPTFNAMVASIEYAPPPPPDMSALVPLTTDNVLDFRLLLPLGGFDSESESIAISPDGTLAVASIYYYNDGDERVDRFDVATGEVLPPLPTTLTYTSDIAFSPDGTLVALSGGFSGGLEVIDLTTDTLLWSVAEDAGNYYATYLAFSPDGTQLAAAVEEGGSALYLLDTMTGEVLAQSSDDISDANVLAFTADGERLIVAVDEIVYVLDGGDLSVISELVTIDDTVTAIAVSPDGGQIVVAGWDYRVRIFDTESLEEVDNFLWGEQMDEAPQHFLFTADGSALFIIGYEFVEMRDVASGETLRTFVMPEEVDDLSISADGTVIGFGTYGGAQIWGISDK